MLVQAVLEDVDVGSLLHIVRESIVVPDNPVTEEVPPLFMLEVPRPDGMMSTSIPGGGGPLPSPVHLQVKPCPNTYSNGVVLQLFQGLFWQF